MEGDGIGQVDPGRVAPACYVPQVVAVGVVIGVAAVGDDDLSRKTYLPRVGSSLSILFEAAYKHRHS